MPPPADSLALEPTTNTWAVVEYCKTHVARLLASNPLTTKAITSAKLKTYKSDVSLLANLLRCGYLPEVRQPDPVTRRLHRRQQPPARHPHHATDHPTLNAHGDAAAPFSVKGLARLCTAATFEPDNRTALGYSEPKVKLRTSLPYVDYPTALALLAAWGDFGRFRDASHATRRYLCLAPALTRATNALPRPHYKTRQQLHPLNAGARRATLQHPSRSARRLLSLGGQEKELQHHRRDDSSQTSLDHLSQAPRKPNLSLPLPRSGEELLGKRPAPRKSVLSSSRRGPAQGRNFSLVGILTGKDSELLMFRSLSVKLQGVLKNLRGYGKLTEKNVADALREVRLALLEADVNYKVAKDFIERTKQKALGQEVLNSVTPGQQIVKIMHDELVALMGGDEPAPAPGLVPPAGHWMMVGLHGCGKTTSCGKLAKLLAKQGRTPLLVACDVHRPAAMDQLETLAKQIGMPAVVLQGETDVLKIARQALATAQTTGRDTLIFDTAGRLHIDEELVQELVRLRDLVKPREILLVADAATGQEAVNIAEHFDKALGLTGIVLTKLDGDARGGAALSMRAATGKPIRFVGVGEKLDDLEVFHPERMASRILGMGDVVALVEKAQAAFDANAAKMMQQKLESQTFDLEDFLGQLQHLKKLGPLENLLGMLPGMGNIPDFAEGNVQMRRMEAIVQSMTKDERRRPEILNASRRARVARGSGTTVSDVNDLLKQFGMIKRMMKDMGKLQKMARGGRLPRVIR